MAVLEGERVLKITGTRKARRYGNWYKDLIGKEFTAITYSIIEAEYTVNHEGRVRILPDEDVTIVRDTSKPKKT